MQHSCMMFVIDTHVYLQVPKQFLFIIPKSPERSYL